VLEARTLQQRWSSLATALEALGPAAQRSLAWGPWQCQSLWAGRHLLLMPGVRPRPAQAIRLWLQLLLAAAAGEEPLLGVLVARDQNSFAVQRRLQPPPAAAAREELERLQSLREQWRGPCWPVPPLTGFTYLEAEAAKAGSGFSKATDAWLGGVGRRGEREQPEMVVCFGPELGAEELLQESLVHRAQELYGPLLEATL
jgi:exodeoxyribonuclease V gamma subunit